MDDIAAPASPEDALAGNGGAAEVVQPVRGFIDRFERLTVTGWAVGPAGKATAVELFCAGRPVRFEMRRLQRADVAEALALPYDEPYGFEIELGPQIWSSSPGVDRPGLMLDLRANGLALTPAVTLTREHLTQWLASLQAATDLAARQNELIRALAHVAWAGGPDAMPPEQAAFVHREADSRGWLEALKSPALATATMRPVQLEGLVETFKDLSFKGWAFDTCSDFESFSLLCNGAEVFVDPVRIGREDVRAALGVKRLELGFELPLPASIWRGAGPDGICNLDILVNGSPLAGGPFRFDRASLDATIGRTREAEKGALTTNRAFVSPIQRRYLSVQLVEHVAEAGGPAVLALPNAMYMRAVAARFGMGHLFDAAPDLEGAPEGEQSATDRRAPWPDESGELIWLLQRCFNKLVRADGANAAGALEETIGASGLRGEHRMRLLATLVPFFCQINRFAELAPWIDQGQLLAVTEVGDAWHQSLLLPFLAHAAEVDATADKLHQLAIALEHGWLNTECVLESARQAVKSYAEGRVGSESMAHFLLASLALLEALGPLPWSRRQDANLIQTMVHLLHHDWLWPDELRARLAESALRLYGLTPDFWQRWARQTPDIAQSAGGRLGVAHRSFSRLHSRLQSARPLTLAELPGLLDELDLFRQCGNPDAEVFERELHQAVAADLFLDPQATAQAVRRLARLHPAEPLRLACFPGANGQPVAVSSITGLEERILAVSGVALADHAGLQAEVLRRIDRLAAEPGMAELGDAYDQLVRLLGPLKQTLAGGVGFELHVRAWLCLQDTVHANQARWAALERSCADQTVQPETDRLPPPGLAAALGMLERTARRLQSRAAAQAEGSPWHALLTGCASALRARLGEQAAALATGWPEQGAAMTPATAGGAEVAWHDGLLMLKLGGRAQDRLRQVLALLEWAYRCTDCTRIFLIDAEAQVQVQRLFAIQPWLAHHYHGRRAQAVEQQTRPGAVIDGGISGAEAIDGLRAAAFADSRTGFTLSRYAVGALLAQSATPAGQALVKAAASDDQCVGDLLAQAGIALSDEGYPTLVRQRTGGMDPQAATAPVAPNAFHAGPGIPTLVMHLGNGTSSTGAVRPDGGGALTPERIWPTLAEPSLGHRPDHNQLELMSPVARAHALRQAPLTVVAVARNEMLLLPHFLAHYRGLGVRHFVVVDNLSDDGTREYLARQPDVVLYCADTEYRHSHFGVAWQQAVLGAHLLGQWVLLADIDEFLVYPGCETTGLPDVAGRLASAGFDAASVHMVDMYPEGKLATADFNVSPPFEAAPCFDREPLVHWKLGSGCYSNGPTWLSALRHRLMPNSTPNAYTSQKIALLRYQPWVRLSDGLHYASGLQVAPKPLYFAHFKYHAAFAPKVAEEIRRKQHFNDAEEYRNYSSLVADAAESLFDGNLSARYLGSASFENLTEPDETA